MPLVLVDLLSYTGTKGGMETYARELYRQFGTMDTGLEFVGMMSSEGYALDHSWFPGEVFDSGISGENRFVWARGELFRVSKEAKRRGADLIHSPATLGPRKSDMPTVVTMHDMLYWSHPELMATPFYTAPVKWMEKQASRNAAHILTDSDSSRSEIMKYLGKDGDLVHVVPLAGTVNPAWKPSGVERRKDLIIAVGNRLPHKNFESLVRALALVDEKVRPTLTVTGSRGDDPLLPVVKELGLEQWVDLRSWVSAEELEQLYATATILAMPSFCDGFCLPALEAMLVDLPVMLSDIPVYREVGGDAALYFDPHSLSSIAEAMTKVATDATLIEGLAAASVEQVAKFSWLRTANETLEVFRAALGRGPSS